MKSVKFNSCLRTIHQIFEYTSLSRMLLEMRIRRYEQEFAVLLSFGSLLILCFDYFNTDWIAFHRDLPSQFHYCHSTLHVPSSPFPFCPFTSYNGSTSTQCFSFGISTSSVNRRCWGSRGGAVNVARRGGARSSGPPRPSTVGAQRNPFFFDIC